MENPQHTHPEPPGSSIATSFRLWRLSLPPELQLNPTERPTSDDIWPYILMALGYRLEYSLYRRQCHLLQKHKNMVEYTIIKQLLRNAIFEIDKIVAQVTTYNLLHMLPLSLYVLSAFLMNCC